MFRAPYGRDSTPRQRKVTADGAGYRLWKYRTPFVLSSQYVLFKIGVLACFDPWWPVLKLRLA
jgi:hypothetical protein